MYVQTVGAVSLLGWTTEVLKSYLQTKSINISYLDKLTKIWNEKYHIKVELMVVSTRYNIESYNKRKHILVIPKSIDTLILLLLGNKHEGVSYIRTEKIWACASLSKVIQSISAQIKPILAWSSELRTLRGQNRKLIICLFKRIANLYDSQCLRI